MIFERKRYMQLTRETIAENIAKLRRANKLTQAELAERLNYSDKAVSKWERGDSIPDVLVLAEIAELFSVTVDYFLHEHSDAEPKPRLESNKKRTRITIFLTACVALYAVAVLIYFILSETLADTSWLWKLFVFPLPFISLIYIVFSAIWARSKIHVCIGVSALLWTALLTVYVFVFSLVQAWMLFVIGAPLQAIIIFWLFAVRKKKSI